MSIADKLQKLIDGKQYVIDKVNAKTGSNLTIDSKWQDVGDTVENITSGLDTTDATATSNDILLGKTAYAKGEKIEGSIETYDGEFEGGKLSPSNLKPYLDFKKSANNLFSSGFGTMTTEQLNELIKYNDTENVENMTNMFNSCLALETIPQLDTSKVTNMSYMFQNCKELTTIPLLDTSSCTNMERMFYNCYKLTTLPLLDTSQATNMSYMFFYCKDLETIPLLDTSSCTNMNYMFYNCSKLTSIPPLYTSNVTNINSMFYNCMKLTEVPLLDTSSCTNMSYMFYGCYYLTSVPLFDTSKVTDMSYMFQNCSNLTTIPQLDTSKVTSMYSMFYGCSKLETIPPLDTRNCTNMNYMVFACPKLTTVDMYGMKVDFSINNSTLFEATELVKIGSNCQVVTSSKKLTIGSTNLAKVTNIYVKYTNQELYEGITCTPCVICESTDEGAMLFTDYMSEKGWTLA